MKEDSRFIPLPDYRELLPKQMIKQSGEFYNNMLSRRTVRDFSSREVPMEVIKNCIRAAGTAPSGANMQPWHFVIVQDAKVKHFIKKEAEKEEVEFYKNKASKEWLDALAPLGTDASKPFLTVAPYLIVVFSKSYDINPQGGKVKNYYVKESVGIACGILLTALHSSGLVTLTHTPSPMAFLNEICERPKNEKPFMIVVAGYPAPDAHVPVHGMQKKELSSIMSTF